MKVKVGLVQMSCVKDKETNIRKAEAEIRKAANSGANIVWKNRVLGQKDATFEKTGWTYNSTLGGVGYDLIYGTVDTAAGTFSTACAQDTYARGNRLHLGLSLLPKEDFTLEYVAYYSPVLSYDIATDALVDTYATGISTAVTPVAGVYEPVDTVGFLSSQTTQHGGLFNAPNTP